MFKATVPALAAAIFLSPAALADSVKTVTLTHQYDTALLSSDAGTGILIADLTQAAERVCSSRTPAYGGRHVDEACASALVATAVKEIHAAKSAEGIEMAPAFERLALVQVASAN